MRSKVFSFLLSLSLMFCVGFGSSITASAADFSAYNGYNIYFSTYEVANNTLGRIFRTDDNSNHYLETTQYINGVHHFQNGHCDNANAVGIQVPYVSSGSSGGEFYFPVNNDIYNYYIVGAFQSYYNNPTFKPDWLQMNMTKADGSHAYLQYTVASGKLDLVLNNTTNSIKGYSFSAKVDFSNYTGFTGIYLISSVSSIPTSTIGNNVNFMASIVEIPKSASQEQVNSIIAAIQKSTTDITGAIGDATDDITGSIGDAADDITGVIEDQYDGDPGSSFPVEDIITQHNQKMGVLSFSSDALMQVLGLLSPDQTLSSELVFPSMSLTIAGQRNKVQLWPEYRFDLNVLKQHWPAFIGLMQSLTSALVWIFVLRYCYRVFEKYFLAGGGS